MTEGWESVRGMVHDNTYFRVYTGQGESLQIGGPVDSTNPAKPADSNNDQFVTPLDALIVINALGRDIIDPSDTENATLYVIEDDRIHFLDTNGDDRLSASDALYVINRLPRRESDQAEPELVFPGAQPETTSSNLLVDAMIVTQPQMVSSACSEAEVGWNAAEVLGMELPVKQSLQTEMAENTKSTMITANQHPDSLSGDEEEQSALTPSSVDLYFTDFDIQ